MKEKEQVKLWQHDEVKALYDMPMNDLLFKAHTIHRKHFDPNQIQLAKLYNVKTGSCPEDCKYCCQSAHYNTNLKKESLVDIEDVRRGAKAAKEEGATRYCIGAAWRKPRDSDLEKVAEMIKAVKDEGLESCVTVGMLTKVQADTLKKVGLDYYNHNIDTSKEHYPNIITTRKFEDRIETLHNVAAAGINICSGGILGMGETRDDRVSMLMTLAELPVAPLSIPINMLMRMAGTPLENAEVPHPFEIIRMIAVARILFPSSYVRLAAGRINMSDEMQAMCFFGGANSLFIGDQLLTATNPESNKDKKLFELLGLTAA